MIEGPLTEADIGKRVVYRSFPDGEPEVGVISSLCPDLKGGQARHHVFVRFRAPNGALTPLSKLDWLVP